ncbi:MAG: sel1 repeat family protein [Succinivibrio sp.]|nr:sel1 repeat family protein [Succinivibrio sp.]
MGCSNLGVAYRNGFGVEQDFNLAMIYYAKACELNDAGGCSGLGHMYEEGLGVRQNRKQASELYGKACDLGLQPGCDEYERLNSADSTGHTDRQTVR